MNQRKPEWLRAKPAHDQNFGKVRKTIETGGLHTVCQSARCPNQGECWSRGTATLMILGNICTRSCAFCAIETGRPTELDLGEPARVAQAVRDMRLRHCVLTSVARDELRDGGASVWAATIRAVRRLNPATGIEVLIPDFKGDTGLVDIVLDARPDILNHNVETVRRLQRRVRVQGRWERSVSVLRHAKNRGFPTKTSLMLGVGETKEELARALRELADLQVNILTLGQYLQPTPRHLPVDRWVAPEEFAEWKKFGLSLGFDVVESGPLVRSSYHADEQSAFFGRGPSLASA